MQERRLRLGDVLDDYCPREKRLTNHVIVALVEDEVRQTRCTTCDTEHPFKHGRVPVRRKKADATTVLYKQVLDDITSRDSGVSDAPAVPEPVAAAVPPPVPAVVARRVDEPVAALAASDGAEPGQPREEPVHRHQLIRATLPRIEGQVPERKPAEFTMWHVTRNAQARRGRGRDPGKPAGHPPHGQAARRNRRGGR